MNARIEEVSIKRAYPKKFTTNDAHQVLLSFSKESNVHLNLSFFLSLSIAAWTNALYPNFHKNRRANMCIYVYMYMCVCVCVCAKRGASMKKQQDNARCL